MTNVIELNDTNFDQEVTNASQPVIVDFYATWCGPCKKQLPVMEELAKEFDGKAKITKLNVDDGRDNAVKYGISSIPALLVFKDGQMVERMIGMHTQSQLSSVLNKHM